MTQGTTPLHTFVLPFNTDIIQAVRVSYEQKGKIVLEKSTADIVRSENNLALTLTQEETLLFDANVLVRIQLHILTTAGSALVSKPKSVPVYILLSKKVIE